MKLTEEETAWLIVCHLNGESQKSIAQKMGYQSSASICTRMTIFFKKWSGSNDYWHYTNRDVRIDALLAYEKSGGSYDRKRYDSYRPPTPLRFWEHDGRDCAT